MKSNVGSIVYFLLLFFSRKIFARGILKDKLIRYSIFIGTAFAFIGYCYLVYFAIKFVFGNLKFSFLLLRLTGLSSIMWVMLFFIIVRILFMKADKLVELTYTLPVTNKERIIAFTLFELFIIIFFSTIFIAPLAMTIAIGGGKTTLIEALFSVFFVIFITYLLCSLTYMISDRLIIKTFLSRFRNLLVPSLFIVLLFSMYNYAYTQSQQIISHIILGQEYFPSTLFLTKLYSKYGFIVALLTGATIIFALLAIILLLTPQEYMPNKQYYRLRNHKHVSVLSAHVVSLARSGETITAVFFTTVLTIALFLYDTSYRPYWLLILSVLGIHVFVNTQPIRQMYRYKINPVMQYVYIISAQLIIFFTVSLPVLIIYLFYSISYKEVLGIIGTSILSMIIATFVSIFFPAEKGNPFAILIGMTVTISIIGIVGIGVMLFELSYLANILVWIAIALIIVIYSIFELDIIEKRKRYELV